MKKHSSEEEIHARLRELAEDARRLRTEINDRRQRPSRADRLKAKASAPPAKSEPPKS